MHLRQRQICIFLFLLLPIFLLLSACHRQNHTRDAQQTATVTQGDIEEVITAQGKLEPKNYVDVGMQVSGQIMKLHVDVGDSVKKGQLLAEIDPRIYQSRLEADQAQLRALEAQKEEQAATVALANIQNKRNQNLLETHVISQDTYDQSNANLKAANAKLKSIQAQIDQTNSTLKADHTNLEYTKIYSPMNGVVASLPVREGQTLNAVQSAPTIMRVADFSVMTLRAQVAEADIPHIYVNMPVYFTTLGDLERHFQGIVRLIQPSPEIINDVVLFDVLVDVKNPEHQLMDSMTTQVFFVTGNAKQVALLPRAALGKRHPKQDQKPYKAYEVHTLNNPDQPMLIQVGLTDRLSAQIMQGLKIGDQVILPEEKPKKDNMGNAMRSRGPSL